MVFESFATNLISGGTALDRQHIYAYDIQGGQATLVSIASDGSEGNDWSQESDVSSDGRYVVFSSNADNLVMTDTNYSIDIFLHDRDVDQDGNFDEVGQVSTMRVNVASDGTPTSNGQSHRPALSYDGQTIVFESADSTLVSGDTNGVADVFVHDRQSPPPTSGADLSVTVCCDRAFAYTEGTMNGAFLISVTNQGPDTAHNVTVNLSGPTTVLTPTQGTCDPTPPGSCNLGTLAAQRPLLASRSVV